MCIDCGRQEQPAILIFRLSFHISHASHVCSQHSFGLPLRINGMHRIQFDLARFDLLPLVIWSRMFWPSVTWKLRKLAQRWSKNILTFGYYWYKYMTFVYLTPNDTSLDFHAAFYAPAWFPPTIIMPYLATSQLVTKNEGPGISRTTVIRKKVENKTKGTSWAVHPECEILAAPQILLFETYRNYKRTVQENDNFEHE